MCEDHEHEPVKKVEIDKSISNVNDAIAAQISDFLEEKRILCVNIMGSPGSGKTSVIENIAPMLKAGDIYVIQGDLESDIDKKRMEQIGIDAYQINTHSGCHLNAEMVNRALMDISLKDKKYLLIENVGNLVCPSGIRIGQHINVVVSSTAEGSDKPKKYPNIFYDASLVVISKLDIAKAVGFNEKEYMKDILNINSKVKILKTSSKQKESFSAVAHFIAHERDHLTGEHRH
ncbi:hydrogenase nickel incorporation protein HypB [Candidatus Woesearchaeota archaeon]|nr:hydrogenase nickel incorporation protein HypB [Candidatus Woesearchaeota archaeon]